MDILNTKIKNILTEKNTKIIPGNIKKDVNILGVTGTYGESDTSNIFTELEYIEGTGTQYINTQINAAITTALILEHYYNGQTTNPFNIAHNYYAGIRINNSQYRLRYGGNNKSMDTNINLILGEKVKYQLNSNGFFINDNLVYTLYNTSIVGWNNTTTKIVLLAYSDINNVVDVSGISSGRIYSCKIYEKYNLVRDLIPVKRKSDNEICLYDKVTKQFFTNQGTGTFIAGPEI